MATKTAIATFTGAEDTVAVSWTGMSWNFDVFTSVSPSDGSGGVTAWVTNVTQTGCTVNVSSRFSGTVTVLAVDVPSAKSVSYLVVEPVNVQVGGTAQFSATAYYSDGTTADVTNSTRFSASTPSVATCTATGAVTAVSNGRATFTAQYGRVTASTMARVYPVYQEYANVAPGTTLAAGLLGSVLNSGQLDIEVSLTMNKAANDATLTDFTALSGTYSVWGPFWIKYTASSESWSFETAAGTDPSYSGITYPGLDATTLAQGWRAGDEVTLRIYRACAASASGLLGFTISVNGCHLANYEQSAFNTIPGAVTSVVLGSDTGGASPAPATVTRFLVNPPLASPTTSSLHTYPVEIFWSGDSTSAGPSDNVALPAAGLYTLVQGRGRGGVMSQASPGDHISHQVTKYTTYKTFLDPTLVKVGVFAVGLNDCIDGNTAATTLGSLQSFINTFKTDFPSAKVVVCALTPAVGEWTIQFGSTAAATYEQKRLDVNTGIMGGGATPITGVDARVNGYLPALTNPDGTLNAAYDKGDGIHENNAGQALKAGYIRSALQALGLV